MAPAHDRPAYDYDWGPAGLEVRFRRLDPTVLDRLIDRKTSREQWTSLCAVQAYFGKGRSRGDLPALIGSYEVRGDVLAFRPRVSRSRSGTPPSGSGARSMSRSGKSRSGCLASRSIPIFRRGQARHRLVRRIPRGARPTPHARPDLPVPRGSCPRTC